MEQYRGIKYTDVSSPARYERRVGNSRGTDQEISQEETTKVFPWQPWTVIACNLVCTDLIRQGQMPHITQWSAYELITKTTFNCYIMPKIHISQFVKSQDGISVQQNSFGSTNLIAGGEVRQALSIRQAIRNFLGWLDLHGFQNVVLVAHGGESYDFPALVSALNNIDELQSFHNRISGFLDSLPLMRMKFPGQPSYKLVDLVEAILKYSYPAHQSEEYTIALAKLLIKSEINADYISSANLTPLDVHISIQELSLPTPASQVNETPARKGQSPTFQNRSEVDTPSALEAEISKKRNWLQYSSDEMLAIRNKMSAMDINHCLKGLGITSTEITQTLPWQPFTVIAFDLIFTNHIREGQMPHITQWSAYELSTKKTFNCYIMPKIPIPYPVQMLTGISVQHNKFRSLQLIAGGEVQQALSIRQAIRNFLDWLDLHEFQNVVLVAHGGDSDEFPVLVSALINNNELERFDNRISGFLDSLPLMRMKFPEQPSYKLVDLVEAIFKDSFSAYQSEEYTNALAKLLIKSEINADYISEANETILDIHFQLKRKLARSSIPGEQISCA